MPIKYWLTLSKSSRISAILLAMTITSFQAAETWAFTDDEVANKMTPKERGTYLAGVVDGLAQARFVKDKPQQAGMQCILNWFYKGGEMNNRRIDTFLARHPDKPASALIHVLVKKECGA